MTILRNMTPASGPRVIPAEVGEPEYYFRHSEEFALVSPVTEYQLATSAVPWDSKPTQEQEFHRPDYSGMRIWDRRLGCYVREPRKPIPVMRRPRPSPSVWGDQSGDLYWVMCREAGVRLRRFRAQTAARAQTVAALYAVSNKLPASAAYALKDD